MSTAEEILKIANIHAIRIESAIKHTKHLFPINSDILKSLPEEDLVWVDFLVNRFGKLQDIIGAKIIDLFLEAKAENIDGLTMLDKINKLERFNILESAELWKDMRKVRNHIAHEYPDRPDILAKYLNQIFDLAPKLIIVLENLKERMNMNS